MKKKIRFIVNPFSGTSAKTTVPELIQKHLDHNRFDYDIVFTEYAGHAISLAKEAVELNFDFAAAVGGDGSVNEVAQSLVHTNTSLIVLPGGSGNGFAMHMGLGRRIQYAIERLNKGNIISVDTCRVNEKFFINVSGLGFDARIAYMTKKNEKRGFFPYLWTSIKEARKFKPFYLEIKADNQLFKGEYAAAVVANASMYGYHFTIAPPASLQDGVMDLMLIKKAPLYRYFFMVFRFLNRTLHKSSIAEHLQAKEITITQNRKGYLHVDGEGFESEQNLQFRVYPQSLKVLSPETQTIHWDV